MKSIRQRAIDGLQVGDSFTVSRTFSEQDIQDFARISRDCASSARSSPTVCSRPVC